MRAHEAFEQMVSRHVWPWLKEQGFKRSKATFHRPVEENWEVINLQRSQWSSRREVSFTVNLEVALGCLRGDRWGVGKRPPAYRCHFHERLGVLLTGSDTWWTLSPDTNINELADSLVLALEAYGLPWLEARSSEERLQQMAGGDLSHLYDYELGFLAQAMDQLGDNAARTRVEAELERRLREGSSEVPSHDAHSS